MIAYFNLVLLDVFVVVVVFSEKHTTSPNKTLIWDNFGEKNKQTNLDFPHMTFMVWFRVRERHNEKKSQTSMNNIKAGDGPV